ncbi:MAG TPA: hypothetical protein VGU21_05800 [Streptosporangiaceae bacterium]|nr:hypothetical protein [Streptosporangiaceae bacterium]
MSELYFPTRSAVPLAGERVDDQLEAVREQVVDTEPLAGRCTRLRSRRLVVVP